MNPSQGKSALSRKNYGINALISFTVGLAALLLVSQSYYLWLPTTDYYIIVLALIVAVIASILYASEVIAVSAILIFSFTIRILYYVFTRFIVFPFGDPYGQFAVLRVFSQSSHISIIPTGDIWATTFYFSGGPWRYSQWPGFQILALGFADLTGLPLLSASILLSLLLYLGWFFLAYALIKALLQNVTGRFSSFLPQISLAVAVALPIFEIPPYFKYDLAATIMLLASLLLLMRSYKKFEWKAGVSFFLLMISISITHSIVAFALILLLGFLYLGKQLVPKIPLLRQMDVKTLKYLPLGVFFSMAAVTTLSWWSYYAQVVWIVIHTDLPTLGNSISLSSLHFVRYSGTAALTLSTPNWILSALSLRDSLVVALLVLGFSILVMRPKIMGRGLTPWLLLAIGLLTALAELDSTINYNDRAFFLFTPLLAVVILVPFLVIYGRMPKLTKWGSVALVGFIMLLLAIGFWGSSYAPVYLYSNSQSSSTFGEHPLNWPSIGQYLSFAPNVIKPNCFLSNEGWVPGLYLPTYYFNVTSVIGEKIPSSGCIITMYSNINSFNSSYNLSPGHLLQNFSTSQFSLQLSLDSDKVFDELNGSVYYYLS